MAPTLRRDLASYSLEVLTVWMDFLLWVVSRTVNLLK